MSGFQSNPQAHFPVPDNPLQQRAYYEVNPVPYDTTVERAHARQDRIRADGPYFMIPPTRDQERQQLEEGQRDGEFAMETYYRVAGEEWEKKKKELDTNFQETSDLYTDRLLMRRDPDNYEEVSPGRFRLRPGGEDQYGFFSDIQNYVPEYDDGVYVEPEPEEDPPYWTYQKGDSQILFPYSSRGPGGGYGLQFYLDMISLAGIGVGFLARYTKQSLAAMKAWTVVQGVWRLLSFYQLWDWKAGVAVSVYWSSAYYLYGATYMPVAYLLDLGAGRLYIENTYDKANRASDSD